ncbi:MAG: ribosomal protein [Planctomycetota bacterium]|jgi:large subunit ribosomal protein L5
MAHATRNYPRLQQAFKDTVGPKAMQEFGLENPHQLPKLMKIVVNAGIGKYLDNGKIKPEVRDQFIGNFRTITGQNPVMIKAKKAVSQFRVREGMPSAFMVTMRRDRMWHFMDRLINLAIPRIKDFRGVKDKSFDKGGSYSMGLTEQAVWPEINMANATITHGMHITFVFENSDPKMSRFILAELGMPFVKPEERSKK